MHADEVYMYMHSGSRASHAVGSLEGITQLGKFRVHPKKEPEVALYGKIGTPCRYQNQTGVQLNLESAEDCRQVQRKPNNWFRAFNSFDNLELDITTA